MSTRAHIFVTILTVSILVFIVNLMRRKQLRPKYSFLWLTVGVGLAVLAISPSLLDKVSVWLGISYGPTTFFMAAIALLFVVVVHFSWELSRLEERTRTLAEELALLRADQPPPKEGPQQGTSFI